MDGLADLGIGGGVSVCAGLFWGQTLFIPFQATKRQKLPYLRFGSGHQVFILYLVDGQGQPSHPMRHELFMCFIECGQIGEGVGKGQAGSKVLEVARQAGVPWVPRAVDDAGLG